MTVRTGLRLILRSGVIKVYAGFELLDFGVKFLDFGVKLLDPLSLHLVRKLNVGGASIDPYDPFIMIVEPVVADYASYKSYNGKHECNEDEQGYEGVKV